MPSRHEPAGIVYAEAAGAGIPVIVAAAGGASEPARRGCGVVGVVVQPGDDEHFSWNAVAERVPRGLVAPEWLGRPWCPYLDL